MAVFSVATSLKSKMMNYFTHSSESTLTPEDMEEYDFIGHKSEVVIAQLIHKITTTINPEFDAGKFIEVMQPLQASANPSSRWEKDIFCHHRYSFSHDSLQQLREAITLFQSKTPLLAQRMMRQLGPSRESWPKTRIYFPYQAMMTKECSNSLAALDEYQQRSLYNSANCFLLMIEKSHLHSIDLLNAMTNILAEEYGLPVKPSTFNVSSTEQWPLSEEEILAFSDLARSQTSMELFELFKARKTLELDEIMSMHQAGKTLGVGIGRIFQLDSGEMYKLESSIADPSKVSFSLLCTKDLHKLNLRNVSLHCSTAIFGYCVKEATSLDEILALIRYELSQPSASTTTPYKYCRLLRHSLISIINFRLINDEQFKDHLKQQITKLTQPEVCTDLLKVIIHVELREALLSRLFELTLKKEALKILANSYRVTDLFLLTEEEIMQLIPNEQQRQKHFIDACSDKNLPFLMKLSKTLQSPFTSKHLENALHVACCHEQIEILEFLVLTLKFSLHECSRFGYKETPLHIACRHGNLGLTSQILCLAQQRDIDITTLLEIKDDNGETPAYVAAKSNHFAILRIFKFCSQNVLQLRSASGFTPLCYLVCNKQSEAIDALYQLLTIEDLDSTSLIGEKEYTTEKFALLVLDSHGEKELHSLYLLLKTKRNELAPSHQSSRFSPPQATAMQSNTLELLQIK